MNNMFRLTDINNTSSTVTIEVAGLKTQINVFFSSACSEILCSYHEHGDSFRDSFAKSIYYMYKETEDCDGAFSERDFIAIADVELYLVLNEILAQDKRIAVEYEKTKKINSFEKIYYAYKSLCQNTSHDISKLTIKNHDTSEVTSYPALASLGKLASLMNFISSHDAYKTSFYDTLKPPVAFPNISLEQHLKVQEIAKKAGNEFSLLQSILRHQPKMEFVELASKLAHISNFSFDTMQLLSPLHHMLKGLPKNKTHSLERHVLYMTERIEGWTSSINRLMLNHFEKWNEKRETLLKFGWFYSDILPYELIDDIHTRRDDLCSEEVNQLIVVYFRKDEFQALKNMVIQWGELDFFKCRGRIFHETLLTHAHECFNASVTLLTLHTEGVITDYVRTSLSNPRLRVKEAIQDIKKALEDRETVSDYESKIFDDVINRIIETFTENFKPFDPDATSNRSRHKIAHGHVYEAETEANSLKQFLYLNELYGIFSELRILEEIV